MTEEDTGGLRDEAGDRTAMMFFEGHLSLSPEEYVARHAHTWGCFSLHRYRYQDAELGAWVRRVGELLFTEGEVARCRREWLTKEEIDVIHESEKEDF